MSVYSDDFEAEGKGQRPETVVEEDHHLRLSLELHSIKDLQSSYQVYSKFSYRLIGTRKTSSVPVRKLQENRIENAFQSHEFFMSKSDLYSFLASNPLIVELWHSDKYSKDSLIGTVTVEMNQILRAPIKKTADTVLRVLDIWQDIQTPDSDQDPSLAAPCKPGQLRVLLYLEDLGAKRKGAVLGQTESPSDYKAVLELEMWKRAEEARWRSGLKQREAEHLSSLSVHWQENEAKRESAVQKALTDLNFLENKARTKALELQKREKALIKLEESKKLKIDEVVRTLALKEEEVLLTRSKFQETASKAGKEARALELQLDKFKQEQYAAEEELRGFKREQDFEAVSKLKQEVEDLMRKNLQMSKDLAGFYSQREELVRGCESTRAEFLRVLYDYEEEKKLWEVREQEKLAALQVEIERIKSESLAMRMSQERECVRCSVTGVKSNWPQEVENPEVRRLREEIDSLVASGMYTEDDAIIQELAKQIKIIQTV